MWNKIVKYTGTLGFAFALHLSSAAQTPVFDAIASDVDGEYSPQRIQQCLLSARVVEYAGANTKLIGADDKKTVRAQESAPKLELYMKDKFQTEENFKAAITEVKADYDYFKSAEKNEQKALFKLAKGINKSCWKLNRTQKIHLIGRDTRKAQAVSFTSSDDAAVCHEIVVKSFTSRASIIDNFGQAWFWQQVYKQSKRREDNSGSTLVEFPKKEMREPWQTMLSEMDPDTALAKRKTCKEKFEDAAFKANIKEPKADTFEFKSAVNWD